MSDFNAELFLKETLRSLAQDLETRASTFKSIAENGAQTDDLNLVLRDANSITNRASNIVHSLSKIRPVIDIQQENNIDENKEVVASELKSVENNTEKEEKEIVEPDSEEDKDLIDSDEPEELNEDQELITEDVNVAPESPEDESEESRTFEEMFGDIWDKIDDD